VRGYEKDPHNMDESRKEDHDVSVEVHRVRPYPNDPTSVKKRTCEVLLGRKKNSQR